MEKPALLIVTELYPNPARPYLGSFVRHQAVASQAWYDVTVLTVTQLPLKNILSFRPMFRRNDSGVKVVSVTYIPAFTIALRLLHLVSPARSKAIDKFFIARLIHRKAQQLHQRTKFTIVHGHEVFLGDEASVIGRKLHIPSVFTLHGLYEYHLAGFGTHVMKTALKNLRLFSTCIAVSNIAARTYLQQGLNPNTLVIIPNGIPEAQQVKPDPEFVSWKGDRALLLSVGFLTAEKRVNQIVSLLQQLHNTGFPNTVLAIVGEGQELRRLHELVTTLQLTESVRFFGTMSAARLSACYAAANVLVHPSVVDSFSMACLEAMSQGTPVVCTTNIGITEYTTNNTDILMVPPDDEVALYTAVTSLLQDPNRARLIGQAGQRTASSLAMSIVAERLHKVYDTL